MKDREKMERKRRVTRKMNHRKRVRGGKDGGHKVVARREGRNEKITAGKKNVFRCQKERMVGKGGGKGEEEGVEGE